METDNKNFILFHRNVPVLKFSMHANQITDIPEVYNEEHAPVGTYAVHGVEWKKFLDWFRLRGIPASRNHIRDLLAKVGLTDVRELTGKSFALSLSDQYWACPEGTKVRWEDVNFFENDFSDSWGDALLGETQVVNSALLDFHTPDNTSDGWLQKRWKVRGGKRYLYKAGSAPYLQEPLNEKIASVLCERLGIRHVSYELAHGRTDKPYCVCEDYITGETELVTAWQMTRLSRKRENEDHIGQYIRVCETVGITDIREEISRMVAVDFLLANTDRHFGNFGVVRRADDLRFLEAFPVYDTGTSLWYNVQAPFIRNTGIHGEMLRCPLEDHLRMVTDTSFLNFDHLWTFPEEAEEILASSIYISGERAAAIAEALRGRIRALDRALASGSVPVFAESAFRAGTAPELSVARRGRRTGDEDRIDPADLPMDIEDLLRERAAGYDPGVPVGRSPEGGSLFIPGDDEDGVLDRPKSEGEESALRDETDEV